MHFKQLHLFNRSQRLPWQIERALGWLLMAANTRPPIARKSQFYELKAALLEQYSWGPQKTVVQHIEKTCWTCDGTGQYYEPGDCRKCYGTGVYKEFWVTLTEWQLGGFVFHTPRVRSYKPFIDGLTQELRVDIEGYITHERHWASREAVLWLFLLFDLSSLWASSCICANTPESFLPLTVIQRCVFAVRSVLRRVQRWIRRTGIRVQSLCLPDDFNDVPFR